MSIFIAQADLNTLQEAALHSKFYSVSQALAATKPGTTERAAALASLDTIKRTIATRRFKIGRAGARGPGF
ncbi:hypothetical protein [Rhodopila sp.]|uniref:hypothetical protein n=1 Tax=Rhodopila sp. TaxID=2480087 RepID=UPI002B6F1831|nr:hypothetical protein [Rhodopila sp.]HVZ10136.1 hypothetical protein [Rhodopila sp.]